MITIDDILETNRMITENKLDVRTITMGISLRDCAHPNIEQFCRNVYDKVTKSAEFLVETGKDIEAEYGIPIINKRVSVTPIAIAADACKTDSYVPVAEALDRAAKEIGINFIGGFSALVEKGYTHGDQVLISSIPQALSSTDLVCSSVNLGSTKAGINMDCVREMGEVIKRTAELTRDQAAIGCAKLVVFCNAPGDNPFMAGAFHGVSEADKVVSVGVSGPGVVKRALEDIKGADFSEVAEMIKRTAFKITRVGQLVAREASRRALRHHRPLACADVGSRRQRRAHLGGDGTRKLRRSRHDSGARALERCGQEGRPHGIFACGRSVGRVHPCQ